MRAPLSPLERADRRRRLEPAHLRHLHVHQDDVERLRAGSPSTASRPLAAIDDFVAAPFEQARRQPLVDGVVFREQHVQPALRQLRRQHRRRQRRALAGLVREDARDRAEQLALIDRLGQMRRDADLAALLAPRRTVRTS